MLVIYFLSLREMFLSVVVCLLICLFFRQQFSSQITAKSDGEIGHWPVTLTSFDEDVNQTEGLEEET